MFKKSFMVMSVAAALITTSGIAQSASAGAQGASTTTNIPVSATVSAACSISTTSAIAFGAYDPIGTNANTALNATGQLSVVCSKGSTGLSIGLDNGAHVSGTQRQMIRTGESATDVLQYGLFQPPNTTPGTACTFPGTTAWSTTATLAIGNSPSKVARLFNVCGSVPAGQDAPTGAYSDVVVATLNF